MPVIADLYGPLGSPDFSANIVSENGIAAQMHNAESAVFEDHIDDGVIDAPIVFISG